MSLINRFTPLINRTNQWIHNKILKTVGIMTILHASYMGVSDASRWRAQGTIQGPPRISSDHLASIWETSDSPINAVNYQIIHIEKHISNKNG